MRYVNTKQTKLRVLALALLSSANLAVGQGGDPARATRSLYEGGVRKCLFHIDVLLKDAHADDDAYAFVTTYGEPVDQAGYTLITVERLGDNAITRTFAVAPDESNGCSVSVTVVTSLASSCAVAREEIFSEWKFYGDLANAAAYELESEQESTLVAAPAPNNGCTIIKSTNHSFIGDDELTRPPLQRDERGS